MNINIYRDQMQHAQLFGKPVLTTNWFIPRETVPDGWYCYDMQGTDADPSRHAVLVDYTTFNHSGTAQEYGQRIAEELRVGAELLGFLDLRHLGQHQINEEDGVFGDKGYVAYKGSQPEIQEVMARHIPSGQEPQMGGLA